MPGKFYPETLMVVLWSTLIQQMLIADSHISFNGRIYLQIVAIEFVMAYYQ